MSIIYGFKARAKLNLVLEVGDYMDDTGYHHVETVMVGLDLHDRYRFAPVYDVQGSSLVSYYEDEVHEPRKAFNILHQAIQKGIEYSNKDISLVLDVTEKILPIGGGLGGSSSAAASLLIALNRIWDLRLKKRTLIHIARQLGCDVPFFFTKGCSWMTDRGDVLREELPIPTLHLVIVMPDRPLYTIKVFKRYEKKRTDKDTMGQRCELMAEVLRKTSDPGSIANCLHNDLEECALKLLPYLWSLKRELIEQGAYAAMLCGSGSSVFGMFGNKGQAKMVARRFAKRGINAHYTFTRRLSHRITRIDTSSSTG